MTKLVKHKGKNYAAPCVAAQIIGYTSDYVTRLAREKKINSYRVGRKWLIDLDSLKLFSLQVAAEKRERKIFLSEERKKEQAIEAFKKYNSVTESQNSTKKKYAHMKASLVMVCLMLFVSSLSILISPEISKQKYFDDERVTLQNPQSASVFSSLMIWWKDLFIKDQVVVIPIQTREVAPQHNANKQSPEIPRMPQVEKKSGMIFVYEDNLSRGSVATIKKVFSDEISVKFKTATSGIIVPQFRERLGEPYQFVLVDENQNTASAEKHKSTDL